MGTDILGSVRSTTSESGSQDGTFEYDVFGSPITGDYTGGVDFGYLGKPYDSATGLYNYGYRDYSPQTARFTTVDPIRDGTNWFVNIDTSFAKHKLGKQIEDLRHDPVNWVDLWGLSATDRKNNMITVNAYGKGIGGGFSIVAGGGGSINGEILSVAFKIPETGQEFSAIYETAVIERTGYSIGGSVYTVTTEATKQYPRGTTPQEIVKDYEGESISVSVGRVS